MNKYIFTTLLISLSLCLTPLSADTKEFKNMRLIHSKTEMTIVDFSSQEILILDPILESFFKDEGIEIPPFLAKNFEGKECVFLDDPLFQKAFKEVYFKFSMDQASYHWEA